MSKYVKIASFGPRQAFDMPSGASNREIFDGAIAYWTEKLSGVKYENPDLLVTPEHSIFPETMDTGRIKGYIEECGLELIAFFKDWAKENRCHIASGMYMFDENSILRNSLLMIDDHGEIIGRYDKNFLAPMEMETAQMSYSDNRPIIETKIGNYAGVICYDMNFIELFETYRTATPHPDVLLYVSMCHGDEILQQRAIFCSSYLVAATIADNTAAIIDPAGKLIEENTFFCDWTIETINLDYVTVLLDGHAANALKQIAIDYPGKVRISNGRRTGIMILWSETDEFTAKSLKDQYGLRGYNEGLDFERAKRQENIK